MEITSPANPTLKKIRALQTPHGRRGATEFVAEGEDLLAAADGAGWFASERLALAGSGLRGTEVAGKLLDGVSALGSGTRALAVYERRWCEPLGPICVALWGVHDPGNIGAVLRSARAFGVDSVVIGPNSADPYSPKAVRASMGAIFQVALARVEDLSELPGKTVALMPSGGELIATVLENSSSSDSSTPADENNQNRSASQASPASPITLVVGSERTGIPRKIVERCDYQSTIPTRVESLNAAMAATIAMYELTRSKFE